MLKRRGQGTVEELGKPSNGGDMHGGEVEGYKVNIKINWISIC